MYYLYIYIYIHMSAVVDAAGDADRVEHAGLPRERRLYNVININDGK